MKYSKLTLVAVLLAIGLSACDRRTETTVVQPVPVPTQPPTVVAGPPGPQGPAGPTGATGMPGAEGEPGKPGKSAVVIVPVPESERK